MKLALRDFTSARSSKDKVACFERIVDLSPKKLVEIHEDLWPSFYQKDVRIGML